MSVSISNKAWVIIALPLLLTACVTKKYQAPEVAQQRMDSLFRATPISDTSNIALQSWNSFYDDSALKAIITKALDQNYDYKNTILQIAQAQAVYKQSKLAFFPSLTFTPQVTYNHSSAEALNFPANVNIRLNTTTVNLGFGTNWEIDVWGKLASAKRGAQASWYQTQSAKQAMETALIAAIATNYYTLMALDEQLHITEQTMLLREKTIKALKVLKTSGVVTGAAVMQAEANYYAAAVSVPDLKQNIRELENSLASMMAAPSGNIVRSSWNQIKPSKDLEHGVPVQLIQNRPDVFSAEQAYRRAFENTNVAKAQFYPTIGITSAGIGISALTHKNLFAGTSAIFYNLVGGIVQPIFNRGNIKTNYKVTQLQQQQALNNFQKAILTAGQEVSNALYAIEMSQEKQKTRIKQVEALEKAVSFNTQLLEYSSTTNYTDVLTSEQSLLSAKLAAVSDQLQQQKARVELYRALGGGWR